MYLILFDCDGTLVDSQETILHGLEVGFGAAGLQMPGRREALSIVGLSLERAFAQLVDPAHQDKVPLMAAAYRASKRERREQGLDFDPLYPGAREAVDRLAARSDVLLGLATGKARRGVTHLLEVHDLEGRFVTIQTADTSPSKPHPDMILRAVSETGVEVDRTVMIGDTSFDMQMARAAGAHGIGVSWGYHESDLLAAAGADLIIDSFASLESALARRLGWAMETV